MSYITRCILVVVAFLVLGACNTMEGLGKDVKKAGDSLEGAASRYNPYSDE